LWLLTAEHLRLGSWDLLKSWDRNANNDLSARMALQLVHESALCTNGIRSRHNMCHQGFETMNGLAYIVTDEEIHKLLNAHTMDDAMQMQVNLGRLRLANGHYKGNLGALDPHRIVTYSKKIMPKKKKLPKEPSTKMLQTFFCTDAETGQPFGCTLGSPGMITTQASIELVNMVNMIMNRQMLLVADTEHFTNDFLSYINQHDNFDIITPAPNTQKVSAMLKEMTYQRQWAGYAISQHDYFFNDNNKDKFFLLGQRSGELSKDFKYKGFISTVDKDILKMLTEDYPDRWCIEEFFNFEGAMGWDRASTMNLNIRYGKMSLALIAQAACYQLKQKLPQPFRHWTADTLANSIFRGIDGDSRIVDDTIVVTMYNVPEKYNLQNTYSNLPQKLVAEGIDPRIPWLFNFKLDFRFK
jgi:hypothetical protein